MEENSLDCNSVLNLAVYIFSKSMVTAGFSAQSTDSEKFNCSTIMG